MSTRERTFGWDDDVLAHDYDETLVDAELRALGGDPDALAARGRGLFAALAPRRAKVLRFPGWVRDGAVYLAAASGGDASEEALEVELGPGLTFPLTLRLEPRWSSDTPGAVVVEWAVEVHHPRGWDLHVYRSPEAAPIVVFLGEDARGTRLLTVAELGFDPVREPFGFVFAARP